MKKEVEEEEYIKWFSELGKKDVAVVGGKGANLGEMYNFGIPVPPGFVVVASAYLYFLEKTRLKEKIYSLLSRIDVENTEELDDLSKKIREMIESVEMPSEIEDEIKEAYEILSAKDYSLERASSDALQILRTSHEDIFVAVRSSATSEDTEAASFAGQQETFLNIKGKSNLIEAIKRCFSSLFTARSIYYRVKKGFKHENILIAVVVQQMVDSEKSGVIFSRDPVTGNENVIIEAVFGLGEGIVSGKIKPDLHIVSRDFEIVSKKIANKNIAIVRDSGGETKIVKLTEEKGGRQVLSEYESKKLADYAIKLEEHYGKPQDIEFAIESGNIYIVQTRPVTTIKKELKQEEKVEGNVILEGEPASPGIGSGEVRVVYKLEDLSKIKKGDILVTKMTNPDMVVTMQRSSAIVTDEGGMTCHAAIISREMGIPCAVGTVKATEVLKDGMFVTVDGNTGKVYKGKVESLREGKVKIEPIVKTETKIKVIVDLPSFAERASKTECKEVGLMRIEGIIAESGKHPNYFLKAGKIEDYENLIFNGISKIGEYFDEMWIRTSDIRSDEYRNLEGAEKEVEINPMLGMHGVRFSLKNPEIFKAELKAIKKASKKKIMGILLPQVILVEEVRETKKALSEIGISENLKIGVMIETPAAVQIIEELCEEGIDFISFGTNDLTQYTLAIDRGNEKVQYLYDETNLAILKQLAHVIKVCKKYGVETSICGQAGSDKKMVDFLVKEGIDSISVNADKAREISEFVRELEESGKKGIGLKEESGEKIVEKNNWQDDIEVSGGEIKEEENKDWKDLDFGIDVFAPQLMEKNINEMEEKAIENFAIDGVIGDMANNVSTGKEKSIERPVENKKEDIYLDIF